MKEEVSILLNLTCSLSLEEADPLMSLLCGKGRLLFYDQLSVMRFPTVRSRYGDHLEKLLASMRNLLESRTLSTEDRGEDVRVIVLMDLAQGMFEPSDELQMRFPAQKVRLFKKEVEEVFGRYNPLLERFRFCFLFLENTAMSLLRRSSFYRSHAFDGYRGDPADWLTAEDLTLEGPWKKAVSGMKGVDDEVLLSDVRVKETYGTFKSAAEAVMDKVCRHLDRLEEGKSFRERADAFQKSLGCVGDFRQADYDGFLRGTLNDLIGLSSESFNRDCFFFLKFTSTPAALKRRDEIHLLSLVLTLVTLSSKDYAKFFPSNAPSVFVLGSLLDADLDQALLLELQASIELCRSRLGESGDLRMKKDAMVSYQVYEAKTDSPREMDPHTPITRQRDKARNKLHEAFVQARRVPLFFGTAPGDWSWYNHVMETVENLYQFELMNGRPLHESPRRITDKEMAHKGVDCSYAELERRIAELEEKEPETLLPEDMNAYLEERKSLLGAFGEAREKLKKEMVKLGYLMNIAWITVFLSLGATLCYALHFFYTGYAEHPAWIGAGLVAILLFFFLGALLAHFRVKRCIESAYVELDDCYRKLGERKSAYLDHVDVRARLQNQADIRRRNLTEMQEKMNLFNQHNLQVDRWEIFFDGLQKKMDDTLDLLHIGLSDKKKPSANLESVQFPIESFPSLPESLCDAFQGRETAFTCFDRPVKGVASFVKRFQCTRIE